MTRPAVLSYPCAPLSILSMALLGLMSGCTLGPDFVRPASPVLNSYTSKDQAAQIAAKGNHNLGGQVLVPEKDIPGLWWQMFRSKPLNALIEKAIKRNPDLKSVQSALTVAQENMLAKSGALFPALDASFTTRHQQVSGAQFGNPKGGSSIFTLYNASVSVSYTLDVFGSIQRQIEGLDAQAEYQHFQLEAAFLTMAANIVTNVIQEASLRAQIATTEEIIEGYRQQLEIIKRQFEIGSISKVNVLSQQALLDQTKTTLPPLRKQLAQVRHQLGFLVGDMPDSAALLAQFNLDDLHLPEQLPLSLPSKLVQQRPDIRAQEAVLHAASAQVGVVAASIFPDFTINADVSSIATAAGNLFAPGTAVWSVAGAALQPLFHGGEFTHKKRAAVASYEQAGADYQRIVLQAFQNVADTLSALEFDNAELISQQSATKSALENLQLISSQFDAGAASHLDLLNAERGHHQARIGLLKAQALRYADTAAFFQALGGGWWNRPDLSKTLTADKKPVPQSMTEFEIPRFRKLK